MEFLMSHNFLDAFFEKLGFFVAGEGAGANVNIKERNN